MAFTDFDKLTNLQEEIDNLYMERMKKDFDIKLEHHNAVKPIIAKRDKIFREEMTNEEYTCFIQTAYRKFGVANDMLPLNGDKEYDASFIKFLTADYLEGNRMRVVLELNENSYVKNSKLEKVIYLFDKEKSESTPIEWVGEVKKCVLFDFFASEDDCLSLFDIIYEFYSDLTGCALIEEDGEE